MEKKKLLLVAVSVGVVLVILIGIPLVMLARQNSAVQSEPIAYPRAVDTPAILHVIDSPADGDISVITPVEAAPQVPAETPMVTTITVAPPRTVAVPDAQQVRPAAPRPVAAAPAARPQQTTPARPQAQARPADPPKTTNYWVQTGAFSTKIRAEGAKQSLEAKGITSIIDNRDINGKTWYRVRVGPYISETEANFWLDLVKSIEGFGESQVRQTVALR